MNRRQMFRSLLGGSVAGAAFVSAPEAARGVVPASGREVVLIPSAVMMDFRVTDSGDGRMFMLTVMETPWPLVGDRVRFDFQDLHLVGVVAHADTEPLYNSGRCLHRISGLVLEFSGKGIHS